MLKLAAIGYGDIATRGHFPELAKFKDRARLVALGGRNRAKAEACAQRYGVRAYTDIDALLASDIDAVLILTPPDSHQEYAVQAIAAGKHVFLEKPMVTSLEEAEAIEAAARGKPLVVFPLPNVASSAYDGVRDLFSRGIIGEVTSVECHKSHRGPTHAGWFYQKEIAGGGVLFDLGVYALGGVATLFGPATHLSALCSTRYPERTLDDGSKVRSTVEDSASVSLVLQSGITVQVNANWNGYLSHHDTRSRITAFGREGMLHFGVPDGFFYVHRADEDYSRFLDRCEPVEFDGYPCIRVPVPEAAPGANSNIGQFLMRIERNDTSPLLLKQQVHVTEIMLTAYQIGGSESVCRLTTSF